MSEYTVLPLLNSAFKPGTAVEVVERFEDSDFRNIARQTIEAMSKQGSSVSDIAEVLGTHRDTIYREFKRCNATLKTYTAAAGQQAL